MSKSPRDEQKNRVLDVLNRARSMELHAIYQYMNQHYNLDKMDLGELAANIKLIAIDEMRHAELFAERIKELDGEPVAEPADKVTGGQEVKEIYPFDSNLEDDTIAKYNQFLKICIENGDSLSMKLFETIIEEEQKHFNYFDNVNSHITTLGASYLAKIAGTPSETGPPSKGFVTKAGNA